VNFSLRAIPPEKRPVWRFVRAIQINDSPHERYFRLLDASSHGSSAPAWIKQIGTSEKSGTLRRKKGVKHKL
jgi:hypothetical protein